MNKITIRDYIGWIVAMLCAFIAGGFFMQKRQLSNEIRQHINKTQEIYNYAQTIQQYIIANNYNLPPVIMDNINNIVKASEAVTTVDIQKNKK